MGGYHAIGIQSIRIIESAKNFGSIVRALCMLDNILSNTAMIDIKQEDIDVLKHLINHYNENDDKIIDDYIYDTFDCFVKNKQEIYIRMFNLNQKVYSSIRSIFWHPLEMGWWKARSKEDKTNLFKKELFQIFKFTKKLTLNYNNYYQISLWSLLSIIKTTSLEQIILKKGFEDYIFSSDLRKEYIESGYEIISGTSKDDGYDYMIKRKK